MSTNESSMLEGKSELFRQLADIVEARKAALADGVWTLREKVGLVSEILEAAAMAASTLLDRQAHFEPIVEDCEAAYDELVAPIDIPRLPDFLERFVDSWCKKMIRPALTLVYDALEDS